MVVYNDNINVTNTLPPCSSTDGHCLPYIVLAFIVSILSFFGSSLNVLIYLNYRYLRTVSRKLFVFVNASNSITSIGVFLSCTAYLGEGYGGAANTLEASSKISAFATLYGLMSSSFWMCALCTYTIVSLTSNRIASANRLIWFFHGFSWAVPGVLVGFALIFDVVGYDALMARQAPVWTWLRSSEIIGREWAYLLRLTWDVLSFIVCLVAFIIVLIYKKWGTMEDTNEANLRSTLSLRYVLVAYVLTRVCGTARLFLQTHSPGYDNRRLATAQTIGDPLQGTVNFIIFCICTKSIRERLIRRLLLTVTCCIGKRATMRRRSEKLKATASAASLHNSISETENSGAETRVDMMGVYREVDHFNLERQDSDGNVPPMWERNDNNKVLFSIQEGGDEKITFNDKDNE